MQQELLKIVEKVKMESLVLLDEINKDIIKEKNIDNLVRNLKIIREKIPQNINVKYQEFFTSFHTFGLRCNHRSFLFNNVEIMKTSLELFIECIDEIEEELKKRIKKCICCGKQVIYTPLPKYYSAMQKKVEIVYESKYETLSEEEYLCPVCTSSDRDRLIISFLKESGLQKAAEGTKVLQFAPATVITNWIKINCPHVDYDTTDLFMDNVTYKSDIQNMQMIQNNTYDVIICSHVLEHVQDDKKAMHEMKRILKPDGKIIFLVPIDLNVSEIDEEWGLTEEENWKRFGQGAHCRRYSKNRLIERLNKFFYIYELNKEYFGEELFKQCGLVDTSTLYILTKSKEASLELEEKVTINKKLCEEGPLVSVILPCYNHEQFVGEAIESVISQSYKNIEIIVMDDASTDGTADVMKKYSSYFTKEFYLNENTGADISILLKNTRGKYIALMHSDDVWEKDKIALQVQYLEEHAEVDVCLSWCKYIDEESKEIENNIFIQKNRSSYEWMRFFWDYGNALCNPSLLMRAKMADELQTYGLACRQLPDFFKWVCTIQNHSIYIIPKVLIRMKTYQRIAQENTSAPTRINGYRHMVEEGANWIGIIRDMEENFFKKTFKDVLINSEIETKEELKCEKYFLLLSHRNIFVQNSAFIYLSENYNEIKKCMDQNYKYRRNNIWEDSIKRGFANVFLK